MDEFSLDDFGGPDDFGALFENPPEQLLAGDDYTADDLIAVAEAEQWSPLHSPKPSSSSHDTVLNTVSHSNHTQPSASNSLAPRVTETMVSANAAGVVHPGRGGAVLGPGSVSGVSGVVTVQDRLVMQSTLQDSSPQALVRSHLNAGNMTSLPGGNTAAQLTREKISSILQQQKLMQQQAAMVRAQQQPVARGQPSAALVSNQQSTVLLGAQQLVQPASALGANDGTKQVVQNSAQANSGQVTLQSIQSALIQANPQLGNQQIIIQGPGRQPQQISLAALQQLQAQPQQGLRLLNVQNQQRPIQASIKPNIAPNIAQSNLISVNTQGGPIILQRAPTPNSSQASQPNLIVRAMPNSLANVQQLQNIAPQPQTSQLLISHGGQLKQIQIPAGTNISALQSQLQQNNATAVQLQQTLSNPNQLQLQPTTNSAAQLQLQPNVNNSGQLQLQQTVSNPAQLQLQQVQLQNLQTQLQPNTSMNLQVQHQPTALQGPPTSIHGHNINVSHADINSQLNNQSTSQTHAVQQDSSRIGGLQGYNVGNSIQNLNILTSQAQVINVVGPHQSGQKLVPGLTVNLGGQVVNLQSLHNLQNVPGLNVNQINQLKGQLLQNVQNQQQDTTPTVSSPFGQTSSIVESHQSVTEGGSLEEPLGSSPSMPITISEQTTSEAEHPIITSESIASSNLPTSISNKLLSLTPEQIEALRAQLLLRKKKQQLEQQQHLVRHLSNEHEQQQLQEQAHPGMHQLLEQAHPGTQQQQLLGQGHPGTQQQQLLGQAHPGTQPQLIQQTSQSDTRHQVLMQAAHPGTQQQLLQSPHPATHQQLLQQSARPGAQQVFQQAPQTGVSQLMYSTTLPSSAPASSVRQHSVGSSDSKQTAQAHTNRNDSEQMMKGALEIHSIQSSKEFTGLQDLEASQIKIIGNTIHTLPSNPMLEVAPNKNAASLSGVIPISNAGTTFSNTTGGSSNIGSSAANVGNLSRLARSVSGISQTSNSQRLSQELVQNIPQSPQEQQKVDLISQLMRHVGAQPASERLAASTAQQSHPGCTSQANAHTPASVQSSAQPSGQTLAQLLGAQSAQSSGASTQQLQARIREIMLKANIRPVTSTPSVTTSKEAAPKRRSTDSLAALLACEDDDDVQSNKPSDIAIDKPSVNVAWPAQSPVAKQTSFEHLVSTSLTQHVGESLNVQAQLQSALNSQLATLKQARTTKSVNPQPSTPFQHLTQKQPATPQDPQSYQPPTPHNPSSYRPPTHQNPPSYRPPTPQSQTSCQPLTPQNPSPYQPPTPQNPPSYQPPTPQNPPSYQPPTPQNPPSYQPPTPQNPPSYQPPTPQNPSSYQPPTPQNPPSYQPATPQNPATPNQYYQPLTPQQPPNLQTQAPPPPYKPPTPNQYYQPRTPKQPLTPRQPPTPQQLSQPPTPNPPVQQSYQPSTPSAAISGTVTPTNTLPSTPHTASAAFQSQLQAKLQLHAQSIAQLQTPSQINQPAANMSAVTPTQAAATPSGVPSQPMVQTVQLGNRQFNVTFSPKCQQLWMKIKAQIDNLQAMSQRDERQNQVLLHLIQAQTKVTQYALKQQILGHTPQLVQGQSPQLRPGPSQIQQQQSSSLQLGSSQILTGQAQLGVRQSLQSQLNQGQSQLNQGQSQLQLVQQQMEHCANASIAECAQAPSAHNKPDALGQQLHQIQPAVLDPATGLLVSSRNTPPSASVVPATSATSTFPSTSIKSESDASALVPSPVVIAPLTPKTDIKSEIKVEAGKSSDISNALTASSTSASPISVKPEVMSVARQKMEAFIEGFPAATKQQLLKQLECMNDEQKKQFYETQLVMLLRLQNQQQIRRKLLEQQKQQQNEQAAPSQSEQAAAPNRQVVESQMISEDTQRHQPPSDVGVKAESAVETQGGALTVQMTDAASNVQRSSASSMTSSSLTSPPAVAIAAQNTLLGQPPLLTTGGGVSQQAVNTSQVTSDMTQPMALRVKPALHRFSRAQLFHLQLHKDQLGALKPDSTAPFTNYKDVIKRLLKYHVLQTGEPQARHMRQAEAEFEEYSQLVIERTEHMLAKYQHLLLDESMRTSPSSEMVMLERLFLADERAQLQDDRHVATHDPLNFKPTPYIPRTEMSQESDAVSDAESEESVVVIDVTKPSRSDNELFGVTIKTEETDATLKRELYGTSHDTSDITYDVSHVTTSDISSADDDVSVKQECTVPFSISNPQPVPSPSYSIESGGGLKLKFKASPCPSPAPESPAPKLAQFSDISEDENDLAAPGAKRPRFEMGQPGIEMSYLAGASSGAGGTPVLRSDSVTERFQSSFANQFEQFLRSSQSVALPPDEMSSSSDNGATKSSPSDSPTRQTSVESELWKQASTNSNNVNVDQVMHNNNNSSSIARVKSAPGVNEGSNSCDSLKADLSLQETQLFPDVDLASALSDSNQASSAMAQSLGFDISVDANKSALARLLTSDDSELDVATSTSTGAVSATHSFMTMPFSRQSSHDDSVAMTCDDDMQNAINSILGVGDIGGSLGDIADMSDIRGLDDNDVLNDVAEVIGGLDSSMDASQMSQQDQQDLNAAINSIL